MARASTVIILWLFIASLSSTARANPGAGAAAQCLGDKLAAEARRRLPVDIRAYPARYWVDSAGPQFEKKIYIRGASVQEVIQALWSVDPRGVSFMEIQTLDAVKGTRTRNYFLKPPNPIRNAFAFFGLPKFLGGPDLFQLVGSKIVMRLTERGFIMDVNGPVANGRTVIEATPVSGSGDDYVLVKETGSLGGKIQNFGHNSVFDVTLELQRLLNHRPE